MSDRVPLERVTAVLATWSDGSEKTGSGFLISGRLVLTAAHCVRDKMTGEEAVSVKVSRASDGSLSTGTGIVSCAHLDVAVISLAPDTPWPAELPDLVIARIDRRYSGVYQDCECIGYPLFQRDLIARVRDTSEVHGTIYPTDGADSGRLLIRDPLITPGTLPAEPATGNSRPNRGRSSTQTPWSGLSGALVFYRGSAIGVVVDHNPAQGGSALQAVAFDTIARDSDPAARRIARAIKLPGLERLPWVKKSGQLLPADTISDGWLAGGKGVKQHGSAARRVVGERISASVDVFRDRVTFRSDFRRLLLQRQYPLLCITGRRGIGKSGLVAKVLADFEDENGDDSHAIGGIAYLSTRTGVGILDLARIFHALTGLLGGHERERLESLWGNVGREALPDLIAAMQNLDVVVVLDNLDDLQDPVTGELQDSGLTAFLNSVCRAPRGPVVVTTSQRPLKLPASLHPRRYGIEMNDGLDTPEAIAYVREADVDGAAGLRDAPEAWVLQLVEQVHRVPRGLELLVSLLAQDPARELDPVLSAQASAEEALLAVVTEGFESLAEVERSVVQHVALANAPVPAHDIEVIMAGVFPPGSVKSAVMELVRRRMLGLDESRKVRLHPVDTDYVVRSMAEEPNLRAHADLRIAAWLASQRTEPSAWRTSSDVSPQRREFRHRVRAGDMEGALDLLYQVAEFIVRHGESDRVRTMLDELPEPAPGDNQLALYQHIQGFIGFHEGDIAEAAQYFSGAAIKAEAAGRTYVRANAELWHGTALRSAGRADESIAPLQRALEAAGGAESCRSIRLKALLQLALSQCYIGTPDEALKTVRQLDLTLRPSDSLQARAFLHDATALVGLCRGDLETTLASVAEGIAAYSDSPEPSSTGYLVNVRGLVALIRGDTEGALTDFRSALEEATFVGDVRLAGMLSLNMAWAHLVSGDCRLCSVHAHEAALKLSGQGIAEAESAVALAKAVEAGDGPSLLSGLQDAIAGSHGNPDIFQPSADVLEQLVAQRFRHA